MFEILIIKLLFIILHWVKLEKPILWLFYFLETATNFFLFSNLKYVRVYNFWWKPSIVWYFDCINLFINYMILYVRRHTLKSCHEVYKIVEQVWFNLIVYVEQWQNYEMEFHTLLYCISSIKWFFVIIKPPLSLRDTIILFDPIFLLQLYLLFWGFNSNLCTNNEPQLTK